MRTINAGKLDRFYPIFDSTEWLERLLPLGIKLTQLRIKDKDDADIKAIRAKGIRLGLSTHDNNELDRALSYEPEYLALGPVYPTILKKMKWTEQGLDKVTEWKRLVGDVTLVAIGGMSVERATRINVADYSPENTLPKEDQSVVFVCRSGLCAHRAAMKLQEKWDGDIVLVATG